MTSPCSVVRVSTIPTPHTSNHPHQTYYDIKVTQNNELVDRYNEMKQTDRQQFDNIITSPTPQPYQYIYEYIKETVYIDPTTIDYQIDTLYRKLIDHSIEKNLMVFKKYVFNKDLKHNFYAFCINNTTP